MKNNLRRSVSVLGFAAALGFFGLIPSARADFQWVAPVEAPPPAAMTAEVPPMASAPVAQGPVGMAPLSGPPTMGVLKAPGSSASAAPAPAVPPMPAPAAVDEKPVLGFANNVPLSVALRQILPPDVTYTLGKGVTAGQLVSWQGGGSWRSTLSAMLSPAGMSMREQGKSVTIVKGEEGPSLAAPASAPAPAPAPMPSAPPVPAVSSAPVSLLSPPTDVAPRPDIGAPMPPTVVVSSPKSDEPASLSMQETWTGERGDMLHKVLASWCKRANVELDWQAEYDYPLHIAVSVEGGFEDAVRGLLLGFEDAKPQPFATLHTNAGAGQMVLVVQARGNNYSD